MKKSMSDKDVFDALDPSTVLDTKDKAGTVLRDVDEARRIVAAHPNPRDFATSLHFRFARTSDPASRAAFVEFALGAVRA